MAFKKKFIVSTTILSFYNFPGWYSLLFIFLTVPAALVQERHYIYRSLLIYMIFFHFPFILSLDLESSTYSSRLHYYLKLSRAPLWRSFLTGGSSLPTGTPLSVRVRLLSMPYLSLIEQRVVMLYSINNEGRSRFTSTFQMLFLSSE